MWEFIEQHELDQEDERTRAIRGKETAAASSDFPFPSPACASAGQCAFIANQALASQATSVIIISTNPLLETLHLVKVLSDEAVVTVVNPSGHANEETRRELTRIQNKTALTLRMVNAAVENYLPRLNENDYDLVILGQGVSDWDQAITMSSRLLRSGGVLIINDLMALSNPGNKGGVVNPADRTSQTVAMRDLVAQLPEDEDFSSVLLPIGTGLFFSVRR